MSDPELLARALAFDRAIRLRAAERTAAIDGGVVLRHDRLARKYILNAVMLDAPLRRDAAEVARVADQQLGDLAHRYVVIDDGAAGRRVATELAARGYTVQRLVYMALARAPDRPYGSAAARRLSEAELEAQQLAMAIEERGGDGAVERSLTETLVAGQAALRAGTESIGFGAGGRPGLPACSLTLFVDRSAGLALIDELGTLTGGRGRGLARAAIGAAIAAARELGCEAVIVPADADDWPRRLYRRLGFDEIGEQVALTLADARP